MNLLVGKVAPHYGATLKVTEELSDFQRGTVIGCHLYKSVCQISVLLELPLSTASAVIVKCKRLRATTAQPRSGGPHKLTERDR